MLDITTHGPDGERKAHPTGFASFDRHGELLDSNGALPGWNGNVRTRSAPALLEAVLASFVRIDHPKHEDFDHVLEIWGTPGLGLHASSRDGTEWLLTGHSCKDGGYAYLCVDVTTAASQDVRTQDADAVLRDLVAASPTNLIVFNPRNGDILQASSAARALFGDTQNEDGHWADPADRRTFLELLSSDRMVEEFTTRGRAADSNEFPMKVSARMVKPASAEFVLATCVDLSQDLLLRDETARANARLRDALESIDEGFALFDANDDLVMANRHYREANPRSAHKMKPGTARAEIIETMQNAGDIIGIDDWVESYVRESDAGDTASPRSYELRHRDQRTFLASRSRTREGGCTITWLNITDRKRTEERAREILSETVQSLNVGLSLYDKDLRYVFSNERHNELVYQDITPPKPGEPAAETLQRLLAVGYYKLPPGMTSDEFCDVMIQRCLEYAKNMTIMASNGQIFDASSYRTPLGGYLISFADVTEKLLAEQAAEESDALVRTIVESSPTTFLVSRVDDGKIIYCPPASRERFGELKTTLGFFLKPEDRVAYLEALLPTGAVNDYPVRFKRGDGSVMDGLTSARVIDYKGEKAIVSSTRDITEHLAMQAELEQQREQNHQNEKLSALGELLAGVAHELNNPLSIVVGYALMLQEKIDDPTLKRRVERIGQAAERCARIVKTFLAMARQRPAAIEICSLNGVFETALDVAGYGVRSAGHRIEADLDPALPSVAIDADQVAQVFTNLIVNAQHALNEQPDPGVLSIASRYDRAHEEVVFTISDTGPGIPKELQARIFEPFFTTKEVGTGTGVGLAFSHRIITSHGGTLSVRSVPGEGATFTIRLAPASPLIEVEAVQEPETKSPIAHRILVVDDEADVLEVIRDLLEDFGFDVHACTDAREALQLLQSQQFSAVLTDFKMPGMDGPALLDELRKSAPELAERLAFITGDAMGRNVAGYLAGSGRPYLEKPVVPKDLLELVNSLCSPSEEPSHA